MRNGFGQRLFNMLHVSTLKGRLIASMAATAFICCALMAAVSYNALYSIQQNKIKTTMQYELQQQSSKLQQIYANLLQISQQMTPQGNVGTLVDSYFEERDPYTRSVLSRSISNSIALVTFSNPNVELVTYCSLDSSKKYFANLAVRDNFDVQQMQNITRNVQISYQPPHISQCRFSADLVVSMVRKEMFSTGDEWYIYAEAKTDIASDMQAVYSKGHMKYIFLLLDPQNSIAYSSDATAFRPGSKIAFGKNEGQYGGYIYDKMLNDYGYTTALLMPVSNYNRELYAWQSNMVFIMGIILFVVGLITATIWQLIYRPLHIFEVEMEIIGRGHLKPKKYFTGVVEFDRLFTQFNAMKKQIRQLLQDVEQKEKKRHELEIEMLAYQINPHFLMNTLNSVHWLAVMHGQDEINKVISSLNLLLSYNLGKTDPTATMRSEIQILSAYLDLQLMRYDFNIQFNIIEGEYLDSPVARFILQPIAENAICHGMDDNGTLTVNIAPDDDRRMIEITISDDGIGLSAETLKMLQQTDAADTQQMGRGIGLRYVRLKLESFYGSEASMTIDSQPKQGTSVTLKLPIRKGGNEA